jgi:flagellum-specific ATP synthase
MPAATRPQSSAAGDEEGDGIDLDLRRRLRIARQRLAEVNPVSMQGRVTNVIGLTIEATGPAAAVGSLCEILGSGAEEPPVRAEVVGFRHQRVLLMPLGEVRGIAPGRRVRLRRERPLVRVGRGLLSRVLDALGGPLDGKPPPVGEAACPLYGTQLNPLDRRPIDEPLDLGIRSLNALLTCGRGQRLGIFAGSGVGKSALLGMIARYTRADVNVIALVGERGREVRAFIERDFGDALARSVVIAATSDQPPLVRLRGAYLASSIAEYFRDQGHHVLFMMDSLTRFAMAQREVGLSVGEPPSTRGYTPSVFAALPRLLERAGPAARGSITGLYTVLVEGDDLNEPIADAARSLLDGHVVLSRHLAAQGQYPAVDLLPSVSRVMIDVVPEEQTRQANRVRAWLATHRDAEDLINIGAYAPGKNPKIDEAVAKMPSISEFFRQQLDEPCPLEESRRCLAALVGEASV